MPASVVQTLTMPSIPHTPAEIARTDAREDLGYSSLPGSVLSPVALLQWLPYACGGVWHVELGRSVCPPRSALPLAAVDTRRLPYTAPGRWESYQVRGVWHVRHVRERLALGPYQLRRVADAGVAGELLEQVDRDNTILLNIGASLANDPDWDSLVASEPLPDVLDLAGVAGLVNTHINGRTLKAPLCGGLKVCSTDVQLVRWRPDGQSQVGGGIRSRITALSYAARQRMVWTARNLTGLVSLLTLTYPLSFPLDGRTVKKHWAAMRHWLTRRGVGGFWFLEFQGRGAPHIHVFATGHVPFRELREAWYRIVGSGDPKHLRAGTKAEWLRVPHACGAYAAKESSKMCQKDVPVGYQNVGRFWGVFGGVKAHYQWMAGTLAELSQAFRLARRWYDADRKALARAGGYVPRLSGDNGRYSLKLWGCSAVVRKLLQFLGLMLEGEWPPDDPPGRGFLAWSRSVGCPSA